MREQFKELALEAGGSFFPDVNSTQLEKFGELVVQKCVKVIDDNIPVLDHNEMQEDYAKGYNNAMINCIYYIREHFKVHS